MTITSAADFTLPRGFESDPNSSNKGMTILISNTAFRAFVVLDDIAFACSAGAVLSYFIMASINERPSQCTVTPMRTFANITIYLKLLAMSVVVIAFVTGMYAALARSVGLAILFVPSVASLSFLYTVGV
ncbi:uncharacterized protein LOC132642118 [Lycium barbarum]|uniref:uncharacterized protein LOC132642118 n=1 Tax=Lycium barbarum TaxID=112863 RepID=UPI00293E4F14|nr:uncharacterized protein LOC132642118 [Lycium barbarum]